MAVYCSLFASPFLKGNHTNQISDKQHANWEPK